MTKPERKGLPEPEELKLAYGRVVPTKIRLLDSYDESPDIVAAAGDTVFVCVPPENVEVDECSLFVLAESAVTGCLVPERVYEHEYEDCGS